MTTQTFERTRPPYLISSDPTLLSLPAINAAFASKDLYWCTHLSDSVLRTTLENSYCLGLYLQTTPSTSPTPASTTPPAPEQIGLARIVTDYTTFAYLTDVYVREDFRGKGLGQWLIECVDEVFGGMEYLRRAFLVTSKGQKEGYYERNLGMESVQQGERGLVVMQRLGPAGKYVRDAS
ncbi:hypothetical protein MMC30_002524 [Trapelia coarctata]|nr:hypothetical protein [Trapelia coarctata]